MRHEAPLITIILNVVLLLFDNHILHTDDCIQLFYSHFHYWQGNGGHPMHLSLQVLFLQNGTAFRNKGPLILKYTQSRIYLSNAPQCTLWSVFV